MRMSAGSVCFVVNTASLQMCAMAHEASMGFQSKSQKRKLENSKSLLDVLSVTHKCQEIPESEPAKSARLCGDWRGK